MGNQERPVKAADLKPVRAPRVARLARISHAESLGYKRFAPYAEIGIKKPRWYLNGSYYDFDELPRVPSVPPR